MIENFNDFNLSKEVLKAVVEMGFEESSPIQKQAIPTMLNNEDIIGQAQTGTGNIMNFILMSSLLISFNPIFSIFTYFHL